MIINTTRPGPIQLAQIRLAKGICAMLRLPGDDTLAHIIGSGSESSSEAAVVSWLADKEVDPSDTSIYDACEALRRELGAKLDAL